MKKCQFAHGRTELREAPHKLHSKYKTQKCKKIWSVGTCPYGSRLRFIHDEGVGEDGRKVATTFGYRCVDMIESVCAESDCSSCIVSQISEYSWCEELETHCDSDQDKASVDRNLASVSTMSTALSSSSESSVPYSGQFLPDVKDCESKFFVSIHPCGDDHIYGSMKRLPEFQHTMNL